MVASTCNTKSNFGLQTSVLTGRCDDLECVDFEEEACDAQSAVLRLSDRGTVYDLFVQGFNPQTNGDFELTVQELIPDLATAARLPFLLWSMGKQSWGPRLMPASMMLGFALIRYRWECGM